jgi:hypothetical protein
MCTKNGGREEQNDLKRVKDGQERNRDQYISVLEERLSFNRGFSLAFRLVKKSKDDS